MIVFSQSRCPVWAGWRGCVASPQLCAADSSGGVPLMLAAPAPTFATNPASGPTMTWSPSGDEVAYSMYPPQTNGPLTLYLQRRGEAARELGPGYAPHFSPDGTRLVFDLPSSDAATQAQIAVIGVDGNGRRQITNVPSGAYTPAWSPAGTQIVFQNGFPQNLWLVSPDGTNLRQLTTDGGNNLLSTSPDWSPDGSTILYSHLEAGVLTVRAVSPDGSAARTTTTGTDAVWSPVGDRIAFARHGAILAADADGSNEAAVSALASVASGAPQWLNAEQTKALASNGTCDRTTTQDGQYIQGSDGADTLFVAHNDVRIDGGAGDDLFWVGGTTTPLGAESLSGGAGDDTFALWGGRNTVEGGPGNDRFDAIQISLPQHLDGGEGNDWIRGSWGGDTLLGGAGNDWIYGLGGSDLLLGGAGDDVVAEVGGRRTDRPRIVGDTGNDILKGSHGSDRMDGGPGDDTISGNSGNDVLLGGRGRDTLHGGPGNDTIDAREAPAEGDVVDCGAGRHDVAYVGRFDVVRNCERVIRR